MNQMENKYPELLHSRLIGSESAGGFGVSGRTASLNPVLSFESRVEKAGITTLEVR